MKQRAIGTKLLLAAITLLVVAYFAMQAADYFDDPLTTTLAYTYQVEEGVDLSGYVVRRERVLPDDTNGLLRLQRAEGERVSAGGLVATVYADEASLDRQQEIDRLSIRLEQLRFAQEAANEAEVSVRLDAEIAQDLLDLRSHVAAGRLDKAGTIGTDLRSLVMKRDYTYTGGDDLSAQIADLQAQLQTLRTQAASSTRRLTAPQSGLYSAVVDGYEQVLTPEVLETLTPSSLAALRPEEGVSSRVGKLVLGDEWYYIAAMSAEDAQVLRESGDLALRFSQGVERDLPVTLDDVSQAENGRVTAVFRSRDYLPELTLLRQQSAQVLRRTTEGIRVPKEALRVRETATTTEDGETVTASETGVWCVMGAESWFKPAKVLYTGDSFVLLEPLSQADRTILRPGDEVIITGYDLTDGSVIR